MEEFKGTKGRWVYSAETGTIRGDGGLFAELLINGSEDHNGTLMAAAPELLEALQLTEKAMAEGRNVTYPEWYGVINKARTAIHKALGKE
ncbi:hypothetical protein ACXYHU_001902 [Enterobacter hormaechei]